jgi:hypothetical protein
MRQSALEVEKLGGREVYGELKLQSLVCWRTCRRRSISSANWH